MSKQWSARGMLLAGCVVLLLHPVAMSQGKKYTAGDYQVLQGSGTFEPSAAYVHGGTLVVASDKPCSAHGLDQAFSFSPVDWRLLGGELIHGIECQKSAAPKIEAVFLENGRPRWWDTREHRVVGSGPGGSVSLDGLERAAQEHACGEGYHGPVAFVTVEGAARVYDETWLATRRYRMKGPEQDVVWPRILTSDGRMVWEPKQKVEHAGNDYSLGDIALDGDRLWMLWTWERNFDGTVRDDVKGMIGFVPLTDDGIGDLTILDIEFEGKPEALAFDAGHTYILFDVDGASKGNTPGKFDLKEHEAYVLRLEGRPSGNPMPRAR